MALSQKKKTDILKDLARISAATKERQERVRKELEAALMDTMLAFAKELDATLSDTKEILDGTAGAFTVGAPFVREISTLRGAIALLNKKMDECEAVKKGPE